MALKCRKCGTIWPDSLEDEWGLTKETDGLGPDVHCPRMVDTGKVLPHADGTTEPIFAKCGGRLTDHTLSQGEKERKVHKIGERVMPDRWPFQE